MNFFHEPMPGPEVVLKDLTLPVCIGRIRSKRPFWRKKNVLCTGRHEDVRLYECKKCGNRFLSMQTMSRIPCPDCAAEIDYEIGPDETMEDVVDTAVLLEKIEGEEEVARMDALLSLAVTGGNFDWI